MNDFKSEYQSAIHEMKEYHIDIADCMDEKRHRRRVLKRVQRTTATAFSAVCVVFICGFGTVRAADYIQNIIQVNESGFASGDAVTMAKTSAEGNNTYLLGEQVEMQGTQEDTLSYEIVSVPENSGMQQEMAVTDAALTADMIEMTGASVTGNSVTGNSVSGNSVTQETVEYISVTDNSSDTNNTQTVENASVTGNTAAAAENEKQEFQVKEIPVYNYSSLEELKKSEDIIFPQPSIKIGDNIEATDITVCGDWAMIRYETGEKTLWLERTDYAGTKGHASSKVFPGGITNERSYTTSQGYTYTLVDSVREAADEPLQIHAAITVASYEVYIDFMGFEEKEAMKIIDSIDISLYEQGD